jgi:DNA replication protein DnaC
MNPKPEPLATLLRGIVPPKFDHSCAACGARSTRPGRCLECDPVGRAGTRTATASAMPKRFAWALNLDAPELRERVDPASLEVARSLDLARLDRVTLLGSAGAGKTALAVAIANAWTAATSQPSRFVAALDLGMARQQHALGDGEAETVRAAMTARLLLLDDLGQEPDFGISTIAHVVEHRYDQARPTVATSGLPVESLLSRYGAGVTRRLLETTGGAVVLKLRSRVQANSGG